MAVAVGAVLVERHRDVYMDTRTVAVSLSFDVVSQSMRFTPRFSESLELQRKTSHGTMFKGGGSGGGRYKEKPGRVAGEVL